MNSSPRSCRSTPTRDSARSHCGAAFIQYLSATVRHEVSITEADISPAEAKVTEAAKGLKCRDFTPRPERSKCSFCDVRTVCGGSAGK